MGKTERRVRELEEKKELSKVEQEELKIKKRKLEKREQAGDSTKLAALAIVSNIPYFVLLANFVALIVVLLWRWIPDGAMPYAWTDLLAPFILGTITTAYHYFNASSKQLLYASVAWNFVSAGLIGLSIKFPKKQCPVCKPCPAAAKPEKANLRAADDEEEVTAGDMPY